MSTGIVKWFNAEKGYGFIRMLGEERDIFVHHMDIVMEGYRELGTQQPVEFEIEENGPDRIKAVRVREIPRDRVDGIHDLEEEIA